MTAGHTDPKYCYKFTVTKVYDGDTLTGDVYLGLNVELKDQKVRLFGIDTPEIKGPDKERAIEVRDFVRNLVLDKQVELYTLKDKKGKFGRWLGIIVVDDKNLNELLLEKKMAKEFLC